MRRSGLAVTLAALLLWPLGACGSEDASTSVSDEPSSSEEADQESEEEAEREAEEELEAPVDQSVCVDDATPVDVPTDTFPAEWVYPPETTVYDVEEREGTGTIVTAVSASSFEDVLAFLNGDEVDAGFEITEGETEEQDAEANWASPEWSGRWSIRVSAECPGETVMQVLATPVQQ